ncbi:MAG: hypothetical protein ACFB10_14430 [Salibacteraceae bacterium]
MNSNLLKTLALLLLSLGSFAASAQLTEQEKRQFKPTEQHWGLTFNLTGLIDNISLNSLRDDVNNEALLIRYYYTDNLVFRSGLGFNTFRMKTETVDSVGSSEVKFDSTFSQNNFFFAPGIETHLKGSNKLDPYLGASLAFGAIGKTNIDTDQQTTDTLGLARVTTTEERGGGFSLGINLIAGFNYFFTQNLSIGAEYQLGFRNLRTGGDFTRSTTVFPVSGSSTSTREVGSNVVTDSGLRTSSTAGITLSYFFTRNNAPRARKPKTQPATAPTTGDS